MPIIKNYYTEVAAERTVSQIQRALIAHGASSIVVNYDDKEPVGLSFIVETERGYLPFKLPANIDKVRTILFENRSIRPEKWHHNYEEVMGRINKQAPKIAWRIIKDWIEAQLAIIDTEMVTVEEVFLPYMLVDGDKKTLYGAMVDRGFYLEEGKG